MVRIYLDETGDNGLDTSPGKSEKWFIIAAIIVDDSCVEQLYQELNEMAVRFFHGNEIKSARCHSNKVRTDFLNNLSPNLWRGLIFQVDKTLLSEDSFKWKATFYKRVPRQLYNYLLSSSPDVEIYPDPIGDKDFQDSLKRYFNSKAPLDLFTDKHIRFHFSSSKVNRINQLADFCSGTFFRDLRDGTSDFKCVANRFSIKRWPTIRSVDDCEVVLSEKVERQMFDAATGFAAKFLSENEDNKDPVKVDQCNLVDILLDEVSNGDPFRYVPIRALLDELSSRRGSPIGDYYLRTKVIGKLRMSDVMIVSNRRGGYKLPVSYSEIEEYLRNMSEKVEPMQAKADALAQHIHLIFGINIFDDARWRSLKMSAVELEAEQAC